MNTIHIGHFGFLDAQETAQRYKHVLVIVDAFTRFTWLNPPHLGRLSSIFQNTVIQQPLFRTVFTSKEFAAFITESLIKHRQTAVAAPWANGLVKRINRFLKSLLTKLSNSLTEWKNKLGEAHYIINNTHHSVIKSTPSKLMFG